MEVSGLAAPVPDLRLETAGFFRASGLKILKDAEDEPAFGPPFQGVPPDLGTYRDRGHRRLDNRESVVQQIRMLRLTWRELETD